MRRAFVFMCSAVAVLALVVGCTSAASSDAPLPSTSSDSSSHDEVPLTVQVSPGPDGSVTYTFADTVCGSFVASNGPVVITVTSSAFTDLDKAQGLLVGDARHFTERDGSNGPFFTAADVLANGERPTYNVDSCNEAGNVVSDSWIMPIRSNVLAQPQTVCGTLYYDQNRIAVVTTTGTYLAQGGENRFVRPGDIIRYSTDGVTINKEELLSQDGLAACQQFVPDWMMGGATSQQAPHTI